MPKSSSARKPDALDARVNFDGRPATVFFEEFAESKWRRCITLFSFQQPNVTIVYMAGSRLGFDHVAESTGVVIALVRIPND